MRASDLLGRHVITQSGERRGRVYELRAEHEGERLRLTGLGVSTRALLERFGVAGARREEPVMSGDLYRWEDVIELREGEVVVRDGARPV
jgi:hypothetical protein